MNVLIKIWNIKNVSHELVTMVQPQGKKGVSISLPHVGPVSALLYPPPKAVVTLDSAVAYSSFKSLLNCQYGLKTPDHIWC